jgi:peptidase M1-like protein
MPRRPAIAATALLVLLATRTSVVYAATAHSSASDSTVTVGAPTPDSLARLVMARFAAATPEAFDSIFPDPLGRDVVRAAAQARSVRRADLQKVLWQGPDRAVLLLGGIVRGRGDTTPTAATGSDETNRVRRFSGLYEARRTGVQWTLLRQIPLDTLNRIRAQAVHAAIAPGEGLRVVDTLTLDIGSPYGFAARFSTAARIASVSLDGRPLAYVTGGGLLWFAATPKRGARLVMHYAIAESKPARTGADSASTAPPGYGSYHNTDAWLPFFNYDSGNSFATIDVTATIPAAYRLTTSLPQTETVAGDLRTVVGRSMHPQFIVALMFDRDWQVERSTIATPIGPVVVETFLVPGVRFTHDSLAKVVQRVYQVIGSRFGEPQAPTRYMAIVTNRAVGRGGFSVRMNNAVVGGSDPTRLDEAVLGPSYVLAHETSHGWTMNASGHAANMLQEGWATFAEGRVLGDVYGADVERAFWERQRTGYMGGVDRSGFAGFEGRQSILGNPDNGRIHYYKGSWVLRSLEHSLGSATFDRGMRDYIALRRTGLPAGHEEFIAAMSKAAKRDVHGFVMPWLTGKYIPDVEARVEGSQVVVAQNQPDIVFDLPLDLALTTAAGATVRRSVHLTRRADTVSVADLGAITEVRVDPDHWFLLQRHYGETVRFELAASAAPNAKTVELIGNFISKPMPATLTGDAWVVEMPLTEGRYVWQWRVDGTGPSDEATIAAASAPPSNTARGGVRLVRPIVRIP